MKGSQSLGNVERDSSSKKGFPEIQGFLLKGTFRFLGFYLKTKNGIYTKISLLTVDFDFPEFHFFPQVALAGGLKYFQLILVLPFKLAHFSEIQFCGSNRLIFPL